ncbi:MAG: hypothetical protein Q4G34_01490 [Micrococcus sp.]|nr:hypothetical protein [Micrococcus sp.]
MPIPSHQAHRSTFHGNDVDNQFIAGTSRDGTSGTAKQDTSPYDDAVAFEADLDEASRSAAEA